jgi:hypothetical protein
MRVYVLDSRTAARLKAIWRISKRFSPSDYSGTSRRKYHGDKVERENIPLDLKARALMPM